MSHFSAPFLYAALARRTADQWRAAGFKFHPSTFSAQLQHPEDPIAFRQAALGIIGEPTRVYQKFEAASTLEYALETLHEFASFPAPYAASGWGYREQLAIARAFLEVNTSPEARALLDELGYASTPVASAATASSVANTATPESAATPLSSCLALLRGFPLSDAERAAMDTRDVDEFIVRVLDSDTRTNQEWAVPASGAIIEHWHSIGTTSPFCDFLFLLSRLTDLPKFHESLADNKTAVERMRAEQPQFKKENLALLLDASGLLGLSAPPRLATGDAASPFDFAQASLSATLVAERMLADLARLHQSANDSSSASPPSALQYLLAALARFAHAHVAPTEQGARDAEAHLNALFAPAVDALCAQPVVDAKIAIPVLPSQLPADIQATVQAGAPACIVFDLQCVVELLRDSALLGISGNAPSTRAGEADAATRLATAMLEHLQTLLAQPHQRSEAERAKCVVRFMTASLHRVIERHAHARAASLEADRQHVANEAAVREASEVARASEAHRAGGEAKGISSELLNILKMKEDGDRRMLDTAEKNATASGLEAQRLAAELPQKFASEVDKLCVYRLSDDELARAPTYLSDATLQSALNEVCARVCVFSEERVAALLRQTALLGADSNTAHADRLARALKQHVSVSKVARDASALQVLLVAVARAHERHVECTRAAAEWSTANYKRLYAAAIDTLRGGESIADADIHAANQLGINMALQANIARLLASGGALAEAQRQVARVQIGLRTEKLMHYCARPHTDSIVAYLLSTTLDLTREPGPAGVRLLDWCAIELRTARHFGAFIDKGLRATPLTLFLNTYRAIVDDDKAAFDKLAQSAHEANIDWDQAINCPRWPLVYDTAALDAVHVQAELSAADALLTLHERKTQLQGVSAVSPPAPDAVAVATAALAVAEQAVAAADARLRAAATAKAEAHAAEQAAGAATSLAARRVVDVVRACGTLMHVAVARRSKDAVQFLLRHKVSPNALVPEKVTNLSEACVRRWRSTTPLALALDSCPAPDYPHSAAHAHLNEASFLRADLVVARTLIDGGAVISQTLHLYGGADDNAVRVEVTVLQALALTQYYCAASLRAHFQRLSSAYDAHARQSAIAALYSTSAAAAGDRLATGMSVAAVASEQRKATVPTSTLTARLAAAEARANAIVSPRAASSSSSSSSSSLSSTKSVDSAKAEEQRRAADLERVRSSFNDHLAGVDGDADDASTTTLAAGIQAHARRALPRAHDPILSLTGGAPLSSADEREHDARLLIDLVRLVRDRGVHPQAVTADVPEHALLLALPVSPPLVAELVSDAWGYDFNMPLAAHTLCDVPVDALTPERGLSFLLTTARRALTPLAVAAGAGTQFGDAACALLLATEGGDGVNIDVCEGNTPLAHPLEIAIASRNVRVARRLIRAGIKWAALARSDAAAAAGSAKATANDSSLVALCARHGDAEVLSLCFAAGYPQPTSDEAWTRRILCLLSASSASSSSSSLPVVSVTGGMCMDAVLKYGGGAWLQKQEAAVLLQFLDAALDAGDGLALAPLLVFAKNLHFMGAAGVQRARRCYESASATVVHCAFKYNVPYDFVYEALVAQIEATGQDARRDECAAEFCHHGCAEDAWRDGKMDRAAFRYLTKLAYQHAAHRTFYELAARGGIDLDERGDWLGSAEDGHTLLTHSIVHGMPELMAAVARVRPRADFAAANARGHTPVTLALCTFLPPVTSSSSSSSASSSSQTTVTVVNPAVLSTSTTPLSVDSIEQLLLPLLREGADPNAVSEAGRAPPLVHLIARPLLGGDDGASAARRVRLLTAFMDACAAGVRARSDDARLAAQHQAGSGGAQAAAGVRDGALSGGGVGDDDDCGVDFSVRDRSGASLEELARQSLPPTVAAEVIQFLRSRRRGGIVKQRTSGSACVLM